MLRGGQRALTVIHYVPELNKEVISIPMVLLLFSQKVKRCQKYQHIDLFKHSRNIGIIDYAFFPSSAPNKGLKLIHTKVAGGCNSLCLSFAGHCTVHLKSNMARTVLVIRAHCREDRDSVRDDTGLCYYWSRSGHFTQSRWFSPAPTHVSSVYVCSQKTAKYCQGYQLLKAG